jgi:hypothetical protein
MKIHILMASAVALVSIGTAANALTLVNKDNVTHTIQYKPNGGALRPVILKGRPSTSIGCIYGCALTVGTT